MQIAKNSRLVETKTLYQLLPGGSEGGNEFARIVNLLLFQEALRSGRKHAIYSDVAGDYNGMDSFSGDFFHTDGTIGYQYKFFPSPLSSKHRSEITKSLRKTASRQDKLNLTKWILVTPEDLIESATRSDGGDVTWFENLRIKLGLNFELEHFGHRKLQSLFMASPSISLFYYPELIANGKKQRQSIQQLSNTYKESFIKLFKDIQFVGMSVYKPEATRGIPIEHIYIPISVIPDGTSEEADNISQINPLNFLLAGRSTVILGDPGCGKSTLIRFLALGGISDALQKRYATNPDARLPILITHPHTFL
ncbi:MAG: signal transduction protein, partial [Capsulimonas sp.]|nr:signal transduction protein [Capsulimonas sp.]